MQLAGETSWKMATDEPQSLLIALYVRDACGLRPQIHPQIPALEPAVPVSEEQTPLTGVASTQWEQWWRELLEGGGFWPHDNEPSALRTISPAPQIQKLF